MKINPVRIESARRLGSGAPVAKPPMASSESEPKEAVDKVDIGGLRRRAGVKRKSVFKRILKSVTNIYHGVNLALAAGPNIGHLVVAKELSRIRSATTGEPQKAPLDWLRETQSKSFLTSLDTVMKAASPSLSQAVGLSLTDLTEVEEHFYQVLAPKTNDDGVKSIAPYLKELAYHPERPPGQARSAFVFLGKKRIDEANAIADLWNSPERPPMNPFEPDDQRSTIWTNLIEQEKKGQLPVFVDMDGDYGTFTGTEFVAKKILSSLGERHSNLGDDFNDTSLYFAWLAERQESFSRDLEPFLEKSDPGLSSQMADVKKRLTPPWLEGKNGLGPMASPDDIERLASELEGVRKERGSNPWIDSLVSLDRDLLTGVQSYWIKLLSEMKRPDRNSLLKPLPEDYFESNLKLPGEIGYDDVAPADGPFLGEMVSSSDITRKERPYDRSVALGEVIEHTLDGLGVEERRELLDSIRDGAVKNLDRINARENHLKEELDVRYAGIDIGRVLIGEVPKDEIKSAIAELQAVSDSQARTPIGQQARRHASLIEFLSQIETRYADVDQVIKGIDGDFSKNPLAVSEFFTPPRLGEAVTPLRTVELSAVRLGDKTDPEPTKLSLVFKGGGGRGFAYVECLKQLEASLADSERGYEVDEYVGTSAGSIMAVLLSAGFGVSELREVMEKIDFTSFNSDAAWLAGGVDPKARGIDRTGLFSTQKMYQTFHELLSEKLGVEGRPVLFSDLPRNLKIVTTLINTDLPEDDPLREHIDSDGRLVFSKENTPNFDVAGALTASAAVPAFFQMPQLLMARTSENGEGPLTRNRLQLADGGVVDNLSLSSASRDEEKRALMLLPAHTHTFDRATGQWVGLDTLNFSTDNLDIVDAQNRRQYAKFAPKFDEYFQRLEDQGVERAVIGFNLAKPFQQPYPAVQGSSESLSLQSIITAQELDLPILPKDKGDDLIRSTQQAPGALNNVVAELFDRYVDNRPGEGDGQGHLHRTDDGFHYHPADTEATDLFHMAYTVGGARLSTSLSEFNKRKFEQPE